MIIALGHKKQVGKDTSGKIIQYLSKTKWEIKQFAYPIKQFVSQITNIPIEEFEKDSVKNSKLGPEWKRVVVEWKDLNYNPFYNYFLNKEQADFFISHFDSSKIAVKTYEEILTVRQALEVIGTDLMRNQFHPNTWVNALFSSYTPESNWIITDLRFHEEANKVKQLGGYTIRIDRNDAEIRWTVPELALNDYKNWDYVIENNGTIKDLETELKGFLAWNNLL